MESSESKTFRNRNERILILLLSFVAAFRVLIFSAAFLLHSRQSLVVDWKAHRILGHSIFVLDSISECSADGDGGLVGLHDCTDICTDARGSAPRSAAAVGFHSSECVLRDEQ